MRQSKENLRSEIDQLRRQQRSNDSVLRALARNEQWEEVLHRLRRGQSVETISDWLGAQLSNPGGAMPTFGRPAAIGANLTPLATFAGASTNSFTPYPAGAGTGTRRTGSGVPDSSIVSPTSAAHPQGARQDMEHPPSPWTTHSHFSAASQARSAMSSPHPESSRWGSGPPHGPPHGPPQTRVGRWVEDSDSEIQSGAERMLAPEMSQLNAPATTWSDITSDTAFAQHLLALYFCWEYPTFASLSKEHFLKDYQEGRPRFCSKILVNALLALGCRFSDKPSTLANPNDPYSSGDHFFKECLRLYHEETNHHNLTTIQALGIMSIREASCGRDSESWYYAGQSIRLAIEMGLHQIGENSGDDDEVAVQSATFWGAFSLDQ